MKTLISPPPPSSLCEINPCIYLFTGRTLNNTRETPKKETAPLSFCFLLLLFFVIVLSPFSKQRWRWPVPSLLSRRSPSTWIYSNRPSLSLSLSSPNSAVSSDQLGPLSLSLVVVLAAVYNNIVRIITVYMRNQMHPVICCPLHSNFLPPLSCHFTTYRADERCCSTLK